jgi:hypothetical protein
MIFNHNNRVYTVECGGCIPNHHGDLERGWVEYDDLERDHEAIEAAVNMIEAANKKPSYTKLLAVEIDYDTSKLRVRVEPVMDQRTAMHELAWQFQSLDGYQESLRVFQDKGSRYDVEITEAKIRRLQAHLGRKVTREEANAYVEADYASEREEELESITI